MSWNNPEKPWTIIRLLLELTTVAAVLHVFAPCGSLHDAWGVLQHADDMQRLGIIVAAVILATGIGEMLAALGVAETWERLTAWLKQRRHGPR